jgi:hypothetical protein
VTNNFGQASSLGAVLRILVPQSLQAPVLAADGSILLTFSDSDGAAMSGPDLPHFQVNASTNLVDWEVLTNTLVFTNGLLQITDGPLTNCPARFYRVQENP